jgi:DNA-binding GntR family transcriptional regulator
MRVLAVLEGHATALAADHLRADDFRELRRINTEMEAARQDPVGFSRLNRRWHFTIYERCPNTYLLELIGETNERLDAVRRTVFTYVPDREEESVAEHAGILDLLERGADFEAIESAARAHKQRTVEAFLVHRHAPANQGEPQQ